MLKVGELFAGVGGFGLGFERAGCSISWQCEVDRYCQYVLRRHYSQSTLFSDVLSLHGGILPSIDVLLFGSPCQDLSIAGTGRGLSGHKSGLFFEAMRIVDEMPVPPTWGIFENVLGALSSNGGRDFETILSEMGKRWDHVGWRVLDAQYAGTPQRRRRVFVIGYSGNRSNLQQVLSLKEGLFGYSSPGSSKKQDAASRSPESVGASCFGGGNCSGPITTTTLTVKTRFDFDSDTFVVEPPVSIHARQTPITLSNLSLPLEAQGGQAIYSGGRVRLLTPTERCRLMGWPDDYNAWGIDEFGGMVEISDTQRIRQTGNGVVSYMSQQIAENILAIS